MSRSPANWTQPGDDAVGHPQPRSGEGDAQRDEKPGQSDLAGRRIDKMHGLR
ncbi:MAG: hypothetical protein QOJ56_6415 [Mycobacterium sp.]|jgi:hypothetical protein|nr:hypothetical protein [Mycobacterium sp.]